MSGTQMSLAAIADFARETTGGAELLRSSRRRLRSFARRNPDGIMT